MMVVTMQSAPYHKHNKNAQLTLANPRDAKQRQKWLQFEVKASSRQFNNLFELMEIRFYSSRATFLT